MIHIWPPTLLGASQSLGIDWSTLGVVAVLIGIFMLAIRLVGAYAERTHPTSAARSDLRREGEAAPLAAGGSVPAEPTLLPQLNESPEVVAILAAAATTMLGRGVRILGIRELPTMNARDQQAWSREGRRDIYMSHRLR